MNAESALFTDDIVPTPIRSGKTYLIQHSRKGTFRLRVTQIRNEWIVGTIMSGFALMVSEPNRERLEEVTINSELCDIYEDTP